LAAGKVILCDRFADSTVAYQGAGHKMPAEIVNAITDIVVRDTWPTITLLLDIPTDEGLRRAAVRYEDKHENRFERLGVDFHQRLRDGYLKRAAEYPQRFTVVDAAGSINQVQQNIVDALNRFAETH
jgi:dTMP kinase